MTSSIILIKNNESHTCETENMKAEQLIGHKEGLHVICEHDRYMSGARNRKAGRQII